MSRFREWAAAAAGAIGRLPTRPELVALAAAGVFLLTAVDHLDVVPRVFEDEPWQASTAASLAARAVFGSDLFAGFFHMDARYYDFLPLNPLVQAAVFKVLGVGLLQARLEAVGASVVTLGLTFALGARLAGRWVGALAVVLLVFVRWSATTYVLLSGIPLVDVARIARYDPLVPVFGLAALHVYLSTRAHSRRWPYACAGTLAGLAGLAHVYGLFWVPALMLLAAWDTCRPQTPAVGQPRRQSALVWLLLGTALPWLPYAAYVLTDLPDWRGQTAGYGDRFDIFNPAWYVANVANEFRRYRPGLGPLDVAWLARPGAWFMLAAVPLGFAWLARRAIWLPDANARAVLVPGVMFPLLFGLFISSKVVNYTLLELPLVYLAIAWALVEAWRAGSRARWLRPLVGSMLLAVIVEGGLRFDHLAHVARATTPYAAFIGQVRARVPAGSRVLALHTYWFGMQAFDYRSFLVPLYLADLGQPLDDALEAVAPDVVIVDGGMRDYFDAPESAPARARFVGWLSAHRAVLLGEVDDPTYGLMEIYAVERGQPAAVSGSDS